MSATASTTSHITRRDWFAIATFWIILATAFLLYAVSKPGGVPLFGDNAMRMVTASELLDGQGWQDLTEHRDNVPYGTTMHWSRIVDAPIAILLAITRPLANSTALEVAATVWPILLLLPLLAMCVMMTRRLVPQAGAVTALGLTMISIVLIVEFLPGRVDHHNVQMLLSLAAACALLIARTSSAGAVFIGIVTATSLAIGMETLPLVAITVTIYALLWLFDPHPFRRQMMAFGLALAIATSIHFVVATSPSAMLTAACDMLTIAYVVPVIIGGLALAAIAATTSGLAWWPRSGALAIGGSATVGAFALLFPQCLAGPYATYELLAAPGYFDLILEARPLLEVLFQNPANAIVYAGAVLVALPLTIWRAFATRGEQRTDWLILLGFLIASIAIMVVQLRGVRFAALFAVPAAAWLIAQARAHYTARPSVQRAGVLIGSWLLVGSAAHFTFLALYGVLAPGIQGAGLAIEPAARRENCILRSNYDKLAALPAGRLMAPFNLGPHLLLFTPHSTVSAGFHRNVTGTKDVMTFFAGDEDSARRVARERGIDYVVVCADLDEYDGPIGPQEGVLWSWLEPMSAPEDALQIYAVDL